MMDRLCHRQRSTPYLRAAPLLGAAVVLLLAGCFEKARQAIPFMPQSKHVMMGGRKLTRSEVAWLEKVKALSVATKVNPRDAVAYTSIAEMFQAKGNYSPWVVDLYRKAIEIDPTLSSPHYNLGRLRLAQQRYSDAVEHLTKARQLSPDDARIRHHLGLALLGADKYEEAVRQLDEAIALDAEYTPAYLEKARVYYSVRRYAEAAGLCRTALNNIPKVDVTAKAKLSHGNALLDKILPSPSGEEEPLPTWRQEAAFDLALCLKAQGHTREALTVLIQAEDAVPAKADVQILKSRLLEAAGDTAGAIATLQLLRQTFPQMAEIPKRMARLHQKLGQNEQAAKLRLEAAELDHSDRELQEEAARHAEAQRDTARLIAVTERLVRLDPEDLRYRRQLARAYDNAGLPRQAALAYQEIVNRLPDDVATRRRMGVLFAELPGFQSRAVLQFKQILEKNPRDAEINRRLGELYLQARNFVEAEKYIRQTLAATPNDPHAHQNLATLYVGQNRFEDAVDEYKRALALDPKLAVAQLNLAKVLLGLGRREEAAPCLRNYLAAKPLDEEALRLLAGALADLGRRDEAMREYEAIAALKPGDVDASMKLADLQKGLGRPRSAIGLYETIIEKNPANVEALREAARLYDDMNMPLRAVFCWQRVLTLKAGDLEAQSRLAGAYKQIGAEDAALGKFEAVGKAGDADAWLQVASLRLKRNERDKACAALKEAIKLRAQDAEARRQLASLLQSSEKTEEKEEAAKLYQELLLLDQKDLSARLNKANLLCGLSRLAEAMEEYRTILDQKPDHVGALVGQAVVLRKRGKFDEAVNSYHEALRADPALKTAHYNMALIYDFYLNDRMKAQLHYERYVELGGDPRKLP
jgi:tetratricopeptide (TPR) repeat protein